MEKPAVALGAVLLAVAGLSLMQSETATAPAPANGFDRCLADPAQWLHPLPLPSALGAFPAEHNASLLWGSYRPAVYFGLRTRTFPAAVFGLFWHGGNADKMRHQCSEGDPIRRYGWEEHDGRTYGSQRIFDDKPAGGNGVILHTKFVKPGQLDGGGGDDVHWAARVAVERSEGATQPTALYLYYGLDCDGELGGEECAAQSQPEGSAGLTVDRSDDGSVTIVGNSASLGTFSLRIAASGVSSEVSAWGGSGVVIADVQEKVAEYLQKRFKKSKGKKAKASISLPNKIQKDSNVVVVRIACDGDCSVDAVLSKGSADAKGASVSADLVSSWLESGSQKFWRKFGKVFGEVGGFAENDKKAAAAALANAIGGMGYFHGRMPVEPAGGGIELSSFPVSLFTAVPSRPFFPRGFAWDEGFHQLLIRRWDADIAADSLAHWMGTLHTSVSDDEACSGLGWLPREQTLGEEARRRVPEQFRKQSPSIANPPTLVLLADALLKASQSDSDSSSAVDVPELLRLLRPRLEQWVAWLLASQRPPISSAQELGDGDFQWRGRSTSDGKLNPNTLGKQRVPRRHFHWPV